MGDEQQVGDAARHCANCGEVLVGPFCAACGQRDVDLATAGLSVLFGEGLRGLRDRVYIVRDSVWLLTVPGRLTRWWLGGRRVRHVNPLRTFLLCAAAGALAATAMAPDTMAWAQQIAPEAAARLTPEQLPLLELFRAVEKIFAWAFAVGLTLMLASVFA